MTEALTLLPPNATPVERSVEQATARIGAVPTPLRALWDADACPTALLPFLAWGLGLQTWDSTWSEPIQRARVRSAIQIARRLGTAASVRDVVGSFGGGVALREWFERSPPGPAHTFELVLTLGEANGAPATAAFVAQVVDEVDRAKPARAHYTVTQGLQSHAGMAAVGGARSAVYRRLRMAA